MRLFRKKRHVFSSRGKVNEGEGSGTLKKEIRGKPFPDDEDANHRTTDVRFIFIYKMHHQLHNIC